MRSLQRSSEIPHGLKRTQKTPQKPETDSVKPKMD